MTSEFDVVSVLSPFVYEVSMIFGPYMVLAVALLRRLQWGCIERRGRYSHRRNAYTLHSA